jgi:hypothetical protein
LKYLNRGTATNGSIPIVANGVKNNVAGRKNNIANR